MPSVGSREWEWEGVLAYIACFHHARSWFDLVKYSFNFKMYLYRPYHTVNTCLMAAQISSPCTDSVLNGKRSILLMLRFFVKFGKFLPLLLQFFFPVPSCLSSALTTLVTCFLGQLELTDALFIFFQSFFSLHLI